MSPTTEHEHGMLSDLTEDECWQHLSAHVLGRLAYVDQGSPIIVPVNYLARDHRVWIRTTPYGHLALHLPGQEAAFEVDQVNEYQHTGWSVLIRGRAEQVADFPVAASGQPDPTPWPDGTRTMMFCLTPREVTGRRLQRRDVSPAIHTDQRPVSD